MTKLGQLLARRKQADGAGAFASRIVGELAEETANQFARRFTATPQKPKKKQVKQAEDTDEEAAQRYRESRNVSAPVSPGETALSVGLNTGINYAVPRLLQHIPHKALKPESVPSVGESAWQLFGPDYVVPNMAVSFGLNTLTAPMADPLYHQGKRSYLKSVGEGALGAAEAMRQRSHEARERYGVGAIPLQMFHGVMNPVAGLTYAGQSLGRLLSTKEGSFLALRAEEQVKRAICEAPQAR
jgi:hypothetical protein